MYPPWKVAVSGQDGNGRDPALDRHVTELYFTRLGQQEALATRAVHTRLNE